MSRKLQGNGIWESSRMILPEHREAVVHERKELRKQMKPELTAEEREELFGRLRVSLSETLDVTLTLFNPYGDELVRGMVLSFDYQLQRVKLGTPGGSNWVDFNRVLKVAFDAE